jgi:hypothetical protein
VLLLGEESILGPMQQRSKSDRDIVHHGTRLGRLALEPGRVDSTDREIAALIISGCRRHVHDETANLSMGYGRFERAN